MSQFLNGISTAPIPPAVSHFNDWRKECRYVLYVAVRVRVCVLPTHSKMQGWIEGPTQACVLLQKYINDISMIDVVCLVAIEVTTVTLLDGCLLEHAQADTQTHTDGPYKM